MLSAFRSALPILFLLLGGCGSELPALQTFARPPANGSCTMVLLPFADRSGYPQAADIFTSIFYARLGRDTGYTLLPAGDISDLYIQLKMYPGQRPTRDQFKMISSRLDAGIFISGEILTMEEDLESHPPRTRLALLIRLYDRQGTMFWSTYHRRRGEDYRQVLHFGRINTITSLARRMADEIIQLWQEKGLQPCAPVSSIP